MFLDTILVETAGLCTDGKRRCSADFARNEIRFHEFWENYEECPPRSALTALARHRNAGLAALVGTSVRNSRESVLAHRMHPLTTLRLVMRHLLGLICAFALGIVPLVGCTDSEGPGGMGGTGGTGGGQTEFTRFAYVTSTDDSVSAYAFDELTGDLHLLGTVAAGTTPWSVTIDPSGRFAKIAPANPCARGFLIDALLRSDTVISTRSLTTTKDGVARF